MGNLRRIKKQMAKQVLLADTKIGFNGRKVLIAVNNPQEASVLAKKFADFMAFLTSRANQVNMGDLMAACPKVLSKMKSGEDFLVN